VLDGFRELDLLPIDLRGQNEWPERLL
jgi:hypothetical protein